MGRRPEKLSITLGKVLARRGMAGRLHEYRVFSRWESMVGKVIASHARPVSLRGKKLTVLVDSSAWMQQLTMLRPEIIEKVQKGLGRDSVQSIMLKLGELPVRSGAAQASKPAPQLPSLSNEELEAVEDFVRDVQDPELQVTLRRLIAKDLRNRKKA